MQALEPVCGVGLSAVDLEVLTRDFYRKRRQAAAKEHKPSEQMHGVRKAAKLARYMAEEGVAGRVMQEFETMQETGGRWHDLLTLRDVARERVGKRSELAELLQEREENTRKEFRELLEV
jgi:CHAD domain-containing protein